MFIFTLKEICFKQNCFAYKISRSLPLCFTLLYILYIFFKHHFRYAKLCLYQLLFSLVFPAKHSSMLLVLLSLDSAPLSGIQHRTEHRLAEFVKLVMSLSRLNGLFAAVKISVALSPCLRWCSGQHEGVATGL